ncbi:MAG: ferritin family protein [Bacillota bacterium]|nr:ferritin family protein [Bacillota bacterium]
MSEAWRTAENLRTALRGELAAISEYEMFARETPYPQIRDLFHHIANEERHHVAEEFRALLMIDPDQAQAYRDVFGGKAPHDHHDYRHD